MKNESMNPMNPDSLSIKIHYKNDESYESKYKEYDLVIHSIGSQNGLLLNLKDESKNESYYMCDSSDSSQKQLGGALWKIVN